MFLQRWMGDHRPQWVVCYVITQGRVECTCLEPPDSRRNRAWKWSGILHRQVCVCQRVGSMRIPFHTPCHPLPVWQKSKPIPDCQITCCPLQTWVMRRSAFAESVRRNELVLENAWVHSLSAKVRVSEWNGVDAGDPRAVPAVLPCYSQTSVLCCGILHDTHVNSRREIYWLLVLQWGPMSPRAEAQSAPTLSPSPNSIFLHILYLLYSFTLGPDLPFILPSFWSFISSTDLLWLRGCWGGELQCTAPGLFCSRMTM